MDNFSKYSNRSNKLTGEKPNNFPLYPFVILAIAVVVSGGVVSSKLMSSIPVFAQTVQKPVVSSPRPFGTGSSNNVLPVTEKDHILGNPNARVKVIEFSDFECPACKEFHVIMNKIMKEYGLTSQVAWVYRHLPIDATHPIKARKEAEASECANELGGRNKFWAFADRLFEITPSNNKLDLKELPNIAKYVGLNVAEFQKCLDSGKYAQHIQADLEDAVNSGAVGTPYNIVIAPNGQKFVLNGGQPYLVMKRIIEKALTLDGKNTATNQ